MYGTEDRGNEKSACAFFFKWGCFLGGVFGGFLFFQDGVFGGGGGLVLAKFVRLFVCSLAFAWGWVGKSALRDVARKDECCWSAAGYGSYLPSRDDGLATHLTLFKPSPTPPINPSPKVTPPPPPPPPPTHTPPLLLSAPLHPLPSQLPSSTAPPPSLPILYTQLQLRNLSRSIQVGTHTTNDSDRLRKIFRVTAAVSNRGSTL